MGVFTRQERLANRTGFGGPGEVHRHGTLIHPYFLSDTVLIFTRF